MILVHLFIISGSKILNPVAQSFPWWLRQSQAESSNTTKNVFVLIVRSHEVVRKQWSFCESHLQNNFFSYFHHRSMNVPVVPGGMLEYRYDSTWVFYTWTLVTYNEPSNTANNIYPVVLVYHRQKYNFSGTFGIWGLTMSRQECVELC